MPSKGAAVTRHGPGRLSAFPNSRKGRVHLRALEYRTGTLSCSASHPQPASMSASNISTSAFSRPPSRCGSSTNQLASPRSFPFFAQGASEESSWRRSAVNARKVICALVEAGFQVFVNPRRIKAFRDAEGLIAKTDRRDAALIARFADKMSQDLRPIPDADQLILKSLSTRRRQLTELIAMEKTRLRQATDQMIIDSCRHLIATLG